MALTTSARRADAAARDERNAAADALVAQPLIHGGQRELNGNAHIVADARGRGARAAAEAVDGDDVRAAAGNAACNGGDVVHRRDLYDDGLFILRCLFERVNELAQILDGINVVMRRGGDGVRALRDHPGLGHVPHDLRARQMSADAGLCALAHFDLDGRTGVQIVLVDAEAAGGYLHDGVGAVLVEILVQAALAGVVVNAELLGGAGERLRGRYS